jgi:hypothetical protein
MDNKSRIIVGTDVGRPDKKTECEKAIQQFRRIKCRHKIRPDSIGADKGYAAGEFIHNLIHKNIQPHIPIIRHRRHNAIGIYKIKDFRYDEEKNIFVCPYGKELKYWGIHKQGRQHVYRARKKDCTLCWRKAECTKDTAWSLSYHIYEAFIDKARKLNKNQRIYNLTEYEEEDRRVIWRGKGVYGVT